MNTQTPSKAQAIDLNRAEIEKVAETLSRRLSVEKGEDLTGLVSRLGGSIEYRDRWDNSPGSGSIQVTGPRNFCIRISQYTSPIRDRFTIAHELGHYFLHYIIPKRKGGMYASRYGTDLAERQANWFAATFLMRSEDYIKEIVDKNLTPLEAADLFKVSLKAAEIRHEQLIKTKSK